MVEKFNMPMGRSPGWMYRCNVALFKEPRYWTLSNSFVKQYIQQRSCSV